jgi:predicted transcriptional regulator
MLTKTQIKIILILLDNRGHAGWEIAEYLEKEDSNLNPILKDLENKKIIYKGKSRISKKQHKKEGDYWEIPYYLEMKLETIKIIIQNIIETNLKETWFIFLTIGDSQYLRSVKTEFKEDVVDMAIDEELRKSPVFSDNHYKELLQHQLHFNLLPPDPKKDEIRYWYYSKYLGIYL